MSLKYGVFGVGRIGRVHAALVREQGNQIVALGDEAAAAIDVAVAELGQPEVATFQSPEEMIAGVEMDAAIIASHTKDHARNAVPFVKAGIPVYLEKPLTDGLEEAFDFVQEVGCSNSLLQIGLQRRYDPALLYTKKLLSEGLIGEVREIRCILRDQFPPPPTYSSRGLVIDMGIHVADEAIFFLDEFPNEVRATVHNTIGYDSPIDEGGDTAFVTFTTVSGVVGRLDLSRTHSSGYNNETYIIGTKGTLHTGRFAGYPGPVYVELWLNDGKISDRSKTFDIMAYLTGEYAEFLPRFETAYKEAHKRFREVVAAGADFAVTQNDVLDAQVFVEAAHRSAMDDGRPFKVQRHDDIAAYRAACVANGLME